MAKNNKWFMTIIILFVSLTTLFGGWFFYQKVILKDPMIQMTSEIEGAIVHDIELDQKQVDVFITLRSGYHFQNTYTAVEKSLQPYLKNRELQIHINNTGNQQLVQAWNKTYFKIAEAIDQKNYSMIPQTIEALQQAYQLDEIGYSMDDKYIFIDLHQGEASLYFVLPRYNGLEVKDVG